MTPRCDGCKHWTRDPATFGSWVEVTPDTLKPRRFWWWGWWKPREIIYGETKPGPEEPSIVGTCARYPQQVEHRWEQYRCGEFTPTEDIP